MSVPYIPNDGMYGAPGAITSKALSTSSPSVVIGDCLNWERQRDATSFCRFSNRRGDDTVSRFWDMSSCPSTFIC